MKIIEEETRRYALYYEDSAGSGYNFPCGKNGEILWEEVSSPEMTQKSLDFCRANPERWTGKNGEVVETVDHTRYGVCPICGGRVYISNVGTPCQCGQWYSVLGSPIRPPEEWRPEDWLEARAGFWGEGEDF